MAKLVLQGVTRQYPGAAQAALKGIDLTVEDGEIMVLVGPSGCGKSTALRIIAGLDLPDAGSVSLDGRELSRVAPQDRDVAMVFQGYALYPHMTVEENIAFPLKMRGVDKAKRAEKAREAASRLGIDKLLARRPAELSGGERQRVAMGRALVRSPKLFLFDEPLSNLDAALRASLRVEIARLLRSIGATAIYVTHDQVEAMTVGDRISVMRGGTIEQAGPARSIYEEPSSSFVASFLGSPSINLLPADALNGRARVAGAEVELPRLGKDHREGALLVGVRPEVVSVRAADEPAPESSLSFVAKVAATEPLGAETILHCEVGDGAKPVSVVAKVPGFFDAAVSDSVRLVIDPKKVHWFDPRTERRLVEERS